MAGKLQNRLLDLIHKKETELGTRLTVRQIARGAGVSERLIYRWLDRDNPPTRYDANVIVGFCEYFAVQPGDLLEYKEDD